MHRAGTGEQPIAKKSGVTKESRGFFRTGISLCTDMIKMDNDIYKQNNEDFLNGQNEKSHFLCGKRHELQHFIHR